MVMSVSNTQSKKQKQKKIEKAKRETSNVSRRKPVDQQETPLRNEFFTPHQPVSMRTVSTTERDVGEPRKGDEEYAEEDPHDGFPLPADGRRRREDDASPSFPPVQVEPFKVGKELLRLNVPRVGRSQYLDEDRTNNIP